MTEKKKSYTHQQRSEAAKAIAEARKPWMGRIWCLEEDLEKLKELGISFGKRALGKPYFVCVIPFKALAPLSNLAREHAPFDNRFAYDIIPTGALSQVMRVQ